MAGIFFLSAGYPDPDTEPVFLMLPAAGSLVHHF